MKMQVSNSSLNRRRLPFRSKISFFECKSRFRGQNQRRIAGYLIQHSVQRRRTADRYRCCPDTSSRRLFLTEGDRLAVIGRPWQPQNVSLALTCMESDNQCPLCESGCRDGVGNKLLIKAIKRVLFGENTKVTSKRLEAFFADPANFDPPPSDDEHENGTAPLSLPINSPAKAANTA